MKRILLSGGGTGGHIYPALAVREILTGHVADLEVGYLGQQGGMEESIVSRVAGVRFFPVRAQGMPREISLKWLSFPVRNLCGAYDAIRHVRAFAPELVVTTGGFVAFPALFAAMVLGIPFVIHEQNAAMGVTNRFFASRARKVLLTYAEAYPPDPARVVVTGNPVRKEFLQPAQHAGRFAKKPGEFWILVVGGSRGALSLNNLCVELTKQWLDDHPEVILLHVSGERDYEMVSRQARSHQRYQVLPYLHEMQEGFAVADVLVSRAGATILAEIGCCGKPAVLVPFPFATDNHQEKNARVLEGRGAARVILDRELTVAALDSALHAMRAPGVLEAMAKQMMTSRPVDVEERIRNVLAECLKK